MRRAGLGTGRAVQEEQGRKTAKAPSTATLREPRCGFTALATHIYGGFFLSAFPCLTCIPQWYTMVKWKERVVQNVLLIRGSVPVTLPTLSGSSTSFSVSLPGERGRNLVCQHWAYWAPLKVWGNSTRAGGAGVTILTSSRREAWRVEASYPTPQLLHSEA